MGAVIVTGGFPNRHKQLLDFIGNSKHIVSLKDVSYINNIYNRYLM